MRYPIEITWRNVPKNEKIEALIREKARKLDQISDDIVSCRVIVEKPQKHMKTGRLYQVRVEIAVPRETIISVQEKAGKGERDEKLEHTIRSTFQTAWRHLREHTRKLRGNVKSHPAQETGASTPWLPFEDEYGVIKPAHARELHFD